MRKAKNNNSLSSSNKGPFDEDWTFIWDSTYESVTKRERMSEMLFYELARELDTDGRYSGDPQRYLSEITQGRFPDTPFLRLTAQEQDHLVERLREPGSLFLQVQRLANRPVFLSSVERQLTDEAEEALEQIAERAAKEEAEKWEGLDSSMLRQGTNPGERAASKARNELLGAGEAILDEAKCLVTLHLDLDYPDHVIQKEFASLLGEIRTKNTLPKKEKETRGKNKDRRLNLSELAAWRMKRQFGSFDKIGDMLTVDRSDDRLPDLPYSGQSGWNKAVARGERMVERFRQWYPCQPV